MRIFEEKAICSEDFFSYQVFNVPRDNVKSLAKIFGELEMAKSQDLIFEYSFSQSTLEQVFIKFAKEN